MQLNFHRLAGSLWSSIRFGSIQGDEPFRVNLSGSPFVRHLQVEDGLSQTLR